MKKIPLRILSYNIHKGFSCYNRKFVLNQIRSTLQRVQPDLVLLQEVVGQNATHSRKIAHWPKLSQFEYIAENFWPYFAYGKNAVYAGGHHGNAILSRFPISDWENLDLSTNPLESRGLLHALIQVPHSSQPLHVICTHLGLFEADRSRQTQKLCDRVASTVPHGEPLVVAGDFNDWRKQLTGTLRRQAALSEAFIQIHQTHARTFPSWLPLFCLDRIYFRSMTPVSAECLSGKPWNGLSDHAALFVQLKI